jgi:hypothetical protein
MIIRLDGAFQSILDGIMTATLLASAILVVVPKVSRCIPGCRLACKLFCQKNGRNLLMRQFQ